MKTNACRRSGFTLIELLCVMVLLTILIGVLGLLVRESLTTERMLAANYERLQQTKALAEQFRADVARADKAPLKWNDHAADENTLILQMKNDAHVVYVWNEKVLQRLAFDVEDSTERTLPIPVGTHVELGRSGPDGKVLWIRLTTVRFEKAVPGQSLEFAAALGGDWR